VIPDEKEDDRDERLLTTSDRDGEIDRSAPTDDSTAFLDETDYASNAVVVEYDMATTSDDLRLVQVSVDSGTAMVDFEYLAASSGVQAEGTELVAVRIDEPSVESAAVCVHYPDYEDRFRSSSERLETPNGRRHSAEPGS